MPRSSVLLRWLVEALVALSFLILFNLWMLETTDRVSAALNGPADDARTKALFMSLPATERFTLNYPPPGTERVFLLTLDALVVGLLVVSLVLALRGRRSLALTAVSVVAAGFVLETAMGRSMAEKPALYLPDPTVFWRLAPNVRSPRFTSQVHWTTASNSLGLRGPEVAAGKPAGAWRVLVLGDSTLFGYGVSEQEMFSARLRDELAGLASGRPVEVVNAAMEGYSSYQGLETLRGLAIEADHLVVGFNNDCEPSDVPDRERAPRSEPERFLMDRLYRSKVYLLLRKTLINAGLAGRPQAAAPSMPSGQRVGRADFQANMEAIFALARERGMGCTVLVLPRNPARQAHFEGYRDLMLSFASRPEVQVLDVFSEWRRPSDATLFIDELHPNAKGHQRLASMVARSLGTRMTGRQRATSPAAAGWAEPPARGTP